MVTTVLAVSPGLELDDCPDDDTEYSALLFGRLVGQSSIEASDLTIIKMAMEVAYADNVAQFTKGLAMAKAERRVDESPGTHGGRVPNRAEALAIAEKKGMSWQEALAVSSVLYCGVIPTESEIVKEGYGSDPAQWASMKERRKRGHVFFTDFVRTRDACAYKAMVTKGATRMAASKYRMGAAAVMLFVSKLWAMTGGQKMPGLMLDYCEEHLEAYKGEGLCSAENPLDTTILTETVLACKATAVVDDSSIRDMTASVAAQQERGERVAAQASAQQSANAKLARRVELLEQQLVDALKTTNATKGPPSADNPCTYCKAPDHFIRDCPKKKEADERRRAGAGVGASTADI